MRITFCVIAAISSGLVFAGDGDGGLRTMMELGVPYRAEHVHTADLSNEPLATQEVFPFSEGLIYYDHGDPTDFEQLMLERVNRARSDPGAEAARLGIGLNDGLAPGTIADTPKPPLAPNVYLTDSARVHSTWMLSADVFSHTGEGGSSPSDRMSAAGYDLSGSYSTGENIAWSGSTGPIDLGQLTLQMHENLFESPGHRTNICDEDFQEVGIGIKEGLFFTQGTNWNAGMTTQNFATSSATPGPFVTGVVYEDDNENGIYDLGEGLAGVEITLSGSGYYAESSTSGGYALPVDAATGDEEVTFTGPDWTESMMVALEAGENVKVDLMVGGIALPWYDGAIELGDGWRWFDWFKSFKPVEGGWLYHELHGWVYVIGEDPGSLFLWDAALNRWLFTSESLYPWLYAFGPEGGWVWFFEDGSPGARFFARGGSGEIVSEEELGL